MTLESLRTASPATQALAATLFTWAVTAAGAAGVFLVRDVSRRVLDAALGFTAGVMIAASFWSLLAPAIALSRSLGLIPWLPSVIGFLAGGAFIRVADHFLPHIHIWGEPGSEEGVKTSWHRTKLLVLAIMMHNIPEGLAVGVAFGAAAAGLPEATFGGAVALALGIGLQNFPEGLAVSVPLRREGLSRLRAFHYGQLTAVVEPAAALAGAFAVMAMRPLLPYAMAFAAGAMIYVVVEEVIPESQKGGNADLATLGAMVGFTVMMGLDVGLG